MRILLFHAWGLGTHGGVDVSLMRLAKAYSEKKCTVGILQMPLQPAPKTSLGDDIPVWSIATPSMPSWSRPRSWASLLRACFRFHAVVSQFKPDIVQVIFASGQIMPMLLALALPRRWRLVISLQGSDVHVIPRSDPELARWQKYMLERAEAVTALTQDMLRAAEETFSPLGSKSQVIPFGVDPFWFEPVETGDNPVQRVVLFVGRLHQVKGVDLLLRAWSQIHEQVPDVQLWLVGDGPEKESLAALAQQLGLNESVSLLGWRERNELRGLYHRAEMLVLPSRSEGLPWTLLEAGACGTLCVASRVGGIPDVIVNGENGFLVEPEAPDALAAAILRALRLAPEEKCRMGEKARHKMQEQYSEETMVVRHLELFKSLLAR